MRSFKVAILFFLISGLSPVAASADAALRPPEPRILITWNFRLPPACFNDGQDPGDRILRLPSRPELNILAGLCAAGLAVLVSDDKGMPLEVLYAPPQNSDN